jgi:hypothetical protein
MKIISNQSTVSFADDVLREVWRIKDDLSASYGHDLDRLFAEAQERQRLSGRIAINLANYSEPILNVYPETIHP